MSIRKASLLGLISAFLTGLALGSEAIPNWAAPATWSPPRWAGVHTMTDVTIPLPFIGVTPCRIWDTRGNGFGGAYGPPSIAANTTRSFVITGQCGIPASAAAVSFNIAALNVSGTGDLRVFPTGGAIPLVSTMNYNANTPNIANAAIVPLGTGGAITLQADGVAIDSIGDVNGYYASIPATLTNPFIVQNLTGAGGYAIYGANGSAAGSATGVLGEILSSTPGPGSAGVRGINNATTGHGVGVLGLHSGNGWGVLGQATGSGSEQRGVVGTAVGSPLSAGVAGTAAATTGMNWGVIGQTLSTTADAAGVRGLDASGYLPSAFHVAGVLGSSQDDIGTYGLSRLGGVLGELYNTADALIAFGLLGTTFGTAGDTAVGPWAVFADGTLGATGAKHFVEPDPREPNGLILYSSLEGREVGTYFRGTAQSSGGRAVIEIPEDFRIVTDDNGLTVQLTPVGAFAQMYVESQDLNQIVVRSSKDMTFHYLVQGVRRAFKDFRPLARGYEFMPLSADAHMPLYLTDEAKRRLIANGTYNMDGTVNMVTAEKAGWTKVWADRKAEEEAAAKKAREAATNRFQFQH